MKVMLTIDFVMSLIGVMRISTFLIVIGFLNNVVMNTLNLNKLSQLICVIVGVTLVWRLDI